MNLQFHQFHNLNHCNVSIQDHNDLNETETHSISYPLENKSKSLNEIFLINSEYQNIQENSIDYEESNLTLFDDIQSFESHSFSTLISNNHFNQNKISQSPISIISMNQSSIDQFDDLDSKTRENSSDINVQFDNPFDLIDFDDLDELISVFNPSNSDSLTQIQQENYSSDHLDVNCSTSNHRTDKIKQIIHQKLPIPDINLDSFSQLKSSNLSHQTNENFQNNKKRNGYTPLQQSLENLQNLAKQFGYKISRKKIKVL
jgi:hypothetical protein